MSPFLGEFMLCTPCRRIFRFQRKPIENVTGPGYYPEDRRVGLETLFYEHHIDPAGFRTSVMHNCRLCRLAWSFIPLEVRVEICRPYDIEEAVIPTAYWHTFRTSYSFSPSSSNPNGWILMFQLPRPGEGRTQNGKTYFGPVYHYENVPVDLTPQEEPLLTQPKHLIDTPHSAVSLSRASLELMARWLDTCNREHTRCHATFPSERLPSLPTRLIEVGDNNNPVLRLVYTKDLPVDQRVLYMPLTHCWGKERFLNLLRSNHDEFLKAIPFDGLTKTFQQMVEIARIIKCVNYVWIDSLCIIQDSPDDWNAECTRMQDVYSNGMLTIAAAHAEGGRDGIESWGDRSMLGPLIVRFRRPNTWRNLLASLFPPVLSADPPDGDYACVDSGLWRREVDQAPAARRAWVAQERFLSRRVLFCGATQLFFTCAEFRACESYPLGCPPSMTAEDVFVEGRAMLANVHTVADGRHRKIVETLKQEAAERSKGNYGGSITTGSVVGSAPVTRVLRIWGDLVKSYSTLELTKFTDKLPAISGIAQRFAPYLEPSLEYCAGLWLSARPNPVIGDLISLQLAWFTRQPTPRRRDCTAPTWSWASVDSPILDAAEMPDFEDPSLPKILSLAVVREIVQLEFEGNSRYGAVKKGVLRLKGKLFPATLKRDDADSNNNALPLLRVRGCGGLSIGLDTSDVDLDGPFVCALLQEKLELLETVRLDGLILRPVMDGPKGRYQRVGIFFADEEEELEALKKPITDAEADQTWHEERVKGFISPEMDSYLFSIE